VSIKFNNRKLYVVALGEYRNGNGSIRHPHSWPAFDSQAEHFVIARLGDTCHDNHKGVGDTSEFEDSTESHQKQQLPVASALKFSSFEMLQA
jgi:hypothetical protein